MVLLLLAIIRTDLIDTWRDTLPPDAPNHFLINLQGDQVEPLRVFLRDQGLGEVRLFPMVKGRLRTIDGRVVSADDYQEERAQRLVRREFNLSEAGQVAPSQGVVCCHT